MSKYAAQHFISQSPQTQFHFMQKDHVESQPNDTEAFGKTGREKIKEAKEQCMNFYDILS